MRESKTLRDKKTKYYDKRTGLKILGSLMENPKLAISKEKPLDADDFYFPTHKTIFIAIYNLAIDGAEKVDLSDIETYLFNFRELDHTKLFVNQNGTELITEIQGDTCGGNYDYYYNNFRKLSLLRNYISDGVDVSCLLNLETLDFEERQAKIQDFESKTISDIIDYFDRKMLNSKQRFLTGSDGTGRKAGERATELRAKMSEAPSYGVSWESLYLNAITRGLIQGKFYLETRDSGMGKSRISIKRGVLMSAPELYDIELGKYIPNPNGSRGVLYLGTEMDIYEELEPIIWSAISGIDEDKIRDNLLSREEEKRLEKAMEIASRTPFYLEDEPNFDVSYIRGKTEKYKREHNVYAVILDYIEITPALTSEYATLSKGMAIREDQVLLYLSKSIKDTAKDFKVAFIAYTQTTDEARRDGIRDQRAVKGARSLPNKADVGMVTFEPTQKELDALEPILKKVKGMVSHRIPNVYISIYKNRGNKYKNVKVWGWQDLGSLEFYDLFCTDKDLNPIDIEKVTIEFNE